MRVGLLIFDGYTDIDLYLHWDLFNRCPSPDVRILGTDPTHVSSTGLTTLTHGTIDEVPGCDAVIVGSGLGVRNVLDDADYVARLHLDPSRQMVGSQCSGALLLAKLGLLERCTATTYPTAVRELERFGVTAVEVPFVAHGNVATAAGCLAAQHLAGWVIERHHGADVRARVLGSIQPVGEGLYWSDEVDGIYQQAQPAR